MIFRKRSAQTPEHKTETTPQPDRDCEPGHENTAPPDSGSAPAQPPKAGIFARLKKGISATRANLAAKVKNLVRSGALDDEFYDDLLEILIGADVGLETGERIVADIRERARGLGLRERSEITGLLKDSISGILGSSGQKEQVQDQDHAGLKVLLIIGVNGTGKTTTIGKLGARFKAMGEKVIFVAADTFRAAAIDQLEIWARRVGVDIIKQREGSDPSAVVFDGLSAALARGAKVVIVDTAGRLHTKSNLMEELKKIRRVISRKAVDARVEVLLVIDATTGQNAIQQARTFSQALEEVHGIILTKLDGTAKGGIVIPIVDQLSIPIRYIGVGESQDDLMEFDAGAFAEALLDRGDSEPEND